MSRECLPFGPAGVALEFLAVPAHRQLQVEAEGFVEVLIKAEIDPAVPKDRAIVNVRPRPRGYIRMAAHLGRGSR
jgi:hypothetical protein